MSFSDATTFVPASTAGVADSFESPVSFKLLYFPIHSNGATSREILSYGQAQWTNLIPKDWDREKTRTPFHVLPVLYIATSLGKELILSEAGVIEQYLSKQWGLLGDNEYEEHLIKVFHSSSASLQNSHASSAVWVAPETRAAGVAAFREGALRTWMESHEKHLMANGNMVTTWAISLADIKTANVIDHLGLQPGGQQLIHLIMRSPALRKVHATVAQSPRIAAWRASQEYLLLSKGTRAFFADPTGMTIKSRV
ncbi:hypothetical protein BGZ70_000016 [Mortierella alpina]|uniref:GST N-terminal domain-containing protein n=1 Tax=Mortierella alpina TaxID=64518 RepID=A0A9P6JFP5_MORAP|nr:hypothetical protein BGZ70_000016 [Mortierella alpina]